MTKTWKKNKTQTQNYTFIRKKKMNEKGHFAFLEDSEISL